MKSILAVFLAAFIWSTSFSVTKMSLNSFGPSTLAFLRFSLSALFLWALIHLSRTNQRRPSIKEAKALALGGFLGYTLYFILENWGLVHIPASNAALLTPFYPIITAILETAFFGGRLTSRQWSGIIISLTGVLLVVQPWNLSSDSSGMQLLGNLLIIGSGVAWALFSITGKRINPDLNNLQVTFYQTAFGAAFFLPLTWTETRFPGPITLHSILGVLYLALACSCAGYLLYNYGLKGIPSSQAVNILNFVPVFGVITAVIFLGERPDLLQIAGGAVVLIGVFLGLQLAREPHPAGIKTESQ
jgi:drug/metabolite transporter (DMT)-like permease